MKSNLNFIIHPMRFFLIPFLSSNQQNKDSKDEEEANDVSSIFLVVVRFNSQKKQVNNISTLVSAVETKIEKNIYKMPIIKFGPVFKKGRNFILRFSTKLL